MFFHVFLVWIVGSWETLAPGSVGRSSRALHERAQWASSVLVMLDWFAHEIVGLFFVLACSGWCNLLLFWCLMFDVGVRYGARNDSVSWSDIPQKRQWLVVNCYVQQVQIWQWQVHQFTSIGWFIHVDSNCISILCYKFICESFIFPVVFLTESSFNVNNWKLWKQKNNTNLANPRNISFLVF